MDDEPTLASHVEAILTAAGHSCMIFNSGRRLLNVLHHETFDLLILDWNVPDFSGLNILGWMKEHIEKYPPVILLTSRSTEEDIVDGLRAGADDYIVKPVQAAILVARVEAALRRAYPAPPPANIETFDDYVFDLGQERVTHAGRPVAMTAKEFLLALLLFRNMHRALSRAYIFEALWGRSPDLPTRTLDAHVSKIRSKLNLRPENGYRLAPVYAYGYRLEKLLREISG
ncbi:winged helix family two component transcriptional regulator [Sphingomonas sp. MM-1]|nr:MULTISPECIES: response regulator transcription factor [Sphingomonas]AGH48623.1 winged helix family two component transcriptional regulator [Sphingomonas sp. MM-1]MDX3885616.1 response regulator transcription factor [Sphingomonas sp.]